MTLKFSIRFSAQSHIYSRCDSRQTSSHPAPCWWSFAARQGASCGPGMSSMLSLHHISCNYGGSSLDSRQTPSCPFAIVRLLALGKVLVNPSLQHVRGSSREGLPSHKGPLTQRRAVCLAAGNIVVSPVLGVVAGGGDRS